MVEAQVLSEVPRFGAVELTKQLQEADRKLHYRGAGNAHDLNGADRRYPGRGAETCWRNVCCGKLWI